jgi:4-hydroxybenzoate polyprenyltransferase
MLSRNLMSLEEFLNSTTQPLNLTKLSKLNRFLKFLVSVVIAIGSVVLMTPALVSLFGFFLILTVFYGVLIKPMLKR